MISGHVLSSHDPWTQQQSPQPVILTTSHPHPYYGQQYADHDFVEFLFGPRMEDENYSSYQCSNFCVPCPDDQPLWYLVLRWLKMMLLKMARSYHAKPVLLAVAPLLVGILIGYGLGTRTRQSHYNPNTTKPHTATTSIWMSIRDFVALVCFRVSVVWMEWTMMRVEKNDGHSSHCEKKCQTTNESLAESSSNSSSNSPLTSAASTPNDDVCIVEEHKEDSVRSNLKSDEGTVRESGVDTSQVPRHVAVIMDGNRRYGQAKYGNISKGHWDGSSKLVEFAKWCIAEQVKVLTVYAFSTENWNRDPAEVASLMAIFSKYCDELRIEALKRNIRILVLSTDTARIPAHVKEGLSRMTYETKHCTGLVMNICLSYGSRGEILNAVRSLAADAACGNLRPDQIDEDEFKKHLLTAHCGDPDVLIRTSGEVRISNYLLWQLAYSEMFFLDKPWPAVEKEDLLNVIRTYAQGRIRRYGK